jgi:hypothetical protein
MGSKAICAPSNEQPPAVDPGLGRAQPDVLGLHGIHSRLMTPSYSQLPCQRQRVDFNGIYAWMSCSKPDKAARHNKSSTDETVANGLSARRPELCLAIRPGWQRTPAKSLVNGTTRYTLKAGEKAIAAQCSNQATQQAASIKPSKAQPPSS